MDPLSVTGTLIAVLQISAAVISFCYEYRQGNKNASREIIQISDELNALRDVLESLLKLVESSNGQLASLELLMKEDGPLLACKRELEALKLRLQPQEGWRKVKSSLVWPLKEGEVRKALGKLERLKGTMQLALSADQAVVSLGLKDDMQDLTEIIQQQGFDHMHQSIYQWVAAPDPYGSHFTNRKKSQAGTGTWLLRSKEYENWILSPKSFLWLYGIPGSGKTVLCSTIIEQLIYFCKQRTQVALVFFYFDFNESKKTSFDGLIRSLVTQLLPRCETIPQVLMGYYLEHKNNSQGIDNKILVEAFQEMIGNLNTVYIVFDALDESTECEEVLRFIENVEMWDLPQIHLLITSRQWTIIEESFGNFSPRSICLQDSKMNSDIIVFIKEKIATDKVMAKWPLAIREQVRSKLVTEQAGMFQWVVCQLDMLRRCLSVAAVRKALAAPFPTNLDETYEKILSGIDEVYQSEVMKVLQALTVSVDHLTLEQVVEILAVDMECEPPRFDPDARLLDPLSILSMCSSLVTSFEPMRTKVWRALGDGLAIRLAHASVADYLTARGSASTFHFTIASARRSLGQICLVYLMNPAFADGYNPLGFTRRMKDFPLLRHAALFWPKYINRDGDHPELLDPMTRELIRAFFNTKNLPNGGNYAFWVGQLIPNSSESTIQNTPPLYYAASFGLLEVVRLILNTEPNLDIDALGGRAHSSPLHVAVYRDHFEVARLLLQRGADPDLRNRFNESPIKWAALNHNDDMYELLIEYGARTSPADTEARARLTYLMEKDPKNDPVPSMSLSCLEKRRITSEFGEFARR